MKYALLAAGAAVAFMAGSALADPLSDAKAGLAAFNGGDNTAAVRLFTAALDSNRLVRADRELAYVKRSEAWLAMEDATRALGDANRALDLDPRDAEAAAARDRAQAILGAPATPTAAAAMAAEPNKTLGDYNAAVAKYDAEKQAAAEAYAKELAAHDAAAKESEARHEAELAAWKEKVAACQADPAKCSDKPAPKTTLAAAAPEKKPVEAAKPKPVVQAAAKPAQQTARKAPVEIERPAIY
ncbi:MAG TPA: hypothetical protein VG166_11700 [Caulobacteraceae bacterium]|jgi:hypothetical protein|nr:hypothetical protein [Caulobacteraceae bacterium]